MQISSFNLLNKSLVKNKDIQITNWRNQANNDNILFRFFDQHMALLRFNTNRITKKEIKKLAPIEFFSKFKPNIENCSFWRGSTLLLMSNSLISLIFWFYLITSSIFLYLSFKSCISISFWCLISCSSSFFYKYCTFSCKISTSRFISWRPCFIYMIWGYSSFYYDVNVFRFLCFGSFCSTYEPILITIGECDKPFLWPLCDVFRIDLYY